MNEPGTGNKQDFSLVALRAFLGRCPNCGRGPLYARYLKLVESCSACVEPLGHIRADDGPAWLTMLVVGHVLAPVLLTVVPDSRWPDWALMTVWLMVALLLALAVLPRAKGLFVAIIWRAQGAGR